MQGENRKIRLYGDPILREITKPVQKIDKDIQKVIADLKKTMLCQDGLGLAANQIGESYAIFVYNPRVLGIDQDPIAVINPKIIEQQGNQEQEEACLSLPGIIEILARPRKVKLIGINEKGKEIELSGSGLLARVFCHEIDHLNGILFIDHLSKMRRQMLKRQLDLIIEKCK